MGILPWASDECRISVRQTDVRGSAEPLAQALNPPAPRVLPAAPPGWKVGQSADAARVGFLAAHLQSQMELQLSRLTARAAAMADRPVAGGQPDGPGLSTFDASNRCADGTPLTA